VKAVLSPFTLRYAYLIGARLIVFYFLTGMYTYAVVLFGRSLVLFTSSQSFRLNIPNIL
jgi:hypothetical protein